MLQISQCFIGNIVKYPVVSERVNKNLISFHQYSNYPLLNVICCKLTVLYFLWKQSSPVQNT